MDNRLHAHEVKPCLAFPVPPPCHQSLEDLGGEYVLVGDSLHDKEVADAVGARCVLCAQGSHAYWRLAAVAPTGRTLPEAVALAFKS